MDGDNNVTLFNFSHYFCIRGIEDGRTYSEEFALNSEPDAIFVMFFNCDDGEYSLGVQLKSNKKGKRIRLDVELWMTNTGHAASRTFEKKNFTFHRSGDRCVFDLQNGYGTILWYDSKECANLAFHCRLTDRSSGKVKPTPEANNLYRRMLWDAYKEGIGLDTKIKVDSGKEFQVAGVLLMSQSPVFQIMFKQEYVEGQTKSVKIDDVDDGTMQAFIKWLYLGEADLKEFGKNLLIFADRYQVTSLKDLCLQFMIDDVHPENVVNYLEFALEYNSDKLKMAAIEFISKMPLNKLDDLFTSTEWIEFSVKHKEPAQEICKIVDERKK